MVTHTAVDHASSLTRAVNSINKQKLPIAQPDSAFIRLRGAVAHTLWTIAPGRLGSPLEVASGRGGGGGRSSSASRRERRSTTRAQDNGLLMEEGVGNHVGKTKELLLLLDGESVSPTTGWHPMIGADAYVDVGSCRSAADEGELGLYRTRSAAVRAAAAGETPANMAARRSSLARTRSVPATGQKRRSRSVSPVAASSDRASRTLCDAVDRQETRENRAPKKVKKSKGAKPASPSVLMSEIGCSCEQCMSAISVLSRSVLREHRGNGEDDGESDAIVLDQKSWLECFDRKHRYGGNLRPYYKAWQENGTPGKHFWDWLDTEPRPELPELPRSKLDAEVVTYLDTDAKRAKFRVQIVNGVMLTSDGTVLDTGESAEGNEWIFVVSAVEQIMYVHRKETQSIPRFHHTSFLGAEPVKVAGQIEVINGQVMSVNLHSGHYRPREDRDLLRFLRALEVSGIDLVHIHVDVQRLVKKARDGGEEKKTQKKHNRQMWKGIRARWFLEHKQASTRLFDEIRRLRRIVDRLLAEDEPQPIVPSAVLPQLRNRTPSISPTDMDSVSGMISPRLSMGGGATGRTSSATLKRAQSDPSLTSPA